MAPRVGIIDYGMGNLHSVYRKLTQSGGSAQLVSSPADFKGVDKLILPGVGHFERAMANLKALDLVESLNESVLVKKMPILGICLGAQLLAEKSEEGDAAGLGWIKGTVVRFKVKDTVHFKIPQTGWNTVSICKKSRLLDGIPDGSEFYFLHSFHYADVEQQDILTQTVYEYEFTSAVEGENVFGTQFHPEKSHDVGLRLFKNFIAL